MFNDPNYLKAVTNTLIFVFTNLNIKMPLALATALAMNRSFKGRRIALALLILPWGIPNVPYYLVFRFILHSDYGILNYFLMWLGIRSPPAWLSDPNYALYSVMAAHAIKNAPFFALIFLAALSSIPTDYYEAAKIDGAGAWGNFRYITIPLMKNIIILNYTLSFVWMMGEFDSVWVMTRGGPSFSSHILGTYAYQLAFVLAQPNLGAAAFVPIVPVLAIAIFILLMKEILKLGGE